jgi:dienelactone hydrolase
MPPSPTAALAGHWYLNRDGARLTLTFASSDGSAPSTGTSVPEASASSSDAIDQISADPAGAGFAFCAHEAAGDVWYSVRLEDGVLAGRYAPVATGAAKPEDLTAYSGRVTGWRDETFNAHIVPRSWDILIDGHTSAVLRVDRSASGATDFVGRLKFYATDGALDEQLAEDVQVESWDGTALSFVRRASPAQERFAGTASGRTIAGTVTPTVGTDTGTAPAATAFTGHRIEILSHGFGAKSATAYTNWQARTRARLGRLVADGNPAPLTFSVTELGKSDPVPDYWTYSRDDDPLSWPQQYKLTELAFVSTLPNSAGGAPLTRNAHGYVAVPTTPPPAGGYPVMLALNGHYGSAQIAFDPGGWFWYGDSFARRGYVVIAVDVGHRPTEDRDGLYIALEGGDSPSTGNAAHPAIKATGLTTDWEESGERTWDAMRALDYVLARPDVNTSRVALAGLSMGGEVSDWVAAMDVRVGTTFAAGSTADLAVMSLHDNHPCWKWQRADAREYFDPGDLTALAAPRVLVRETGAGDYTYSDLATPYSGAKELIRRAQPVFDALGGKVLHYLHFEAHSFHVGAFAPEIGKADGVTIPLLAAPDPSSIWSNLWDADGQTTPMTSTIFDLLPGD